MNSTIHSFSSIISSVEQLYELAKDVEITELEKKIPEYTKAIQQYFINLDKNKLTHNDFENVKKIISAHKMITSLLNSKKEDISKDLKQLHAGKQMQNTYPQTMY